MYYTEVFIGGIMMSDWLQSLFSSSLRSRLSSVVLENNLIWEASLARSWEFAEESVIENRLEDYLLKH